MTATETTIDVLLVDDDESLREVLAEELGRSGFHVTAVPDAESALLAIEESTFDVAIVDLNLPGMSGEELIGEFRERAASMEAIVATLSPKGMDQRSRAIGVTFRAAASQ